MGWQDGNPPWAGRRSEARRLEVQGGDAQEGGGSGAQMRIGSPARGIWGQFVREGARLCGARLGERRESAVNWTFGGDGGAESKE